MTKKRRGFAILLAVVLSAGSFGGYVPAYAETVQEQTSELSIPQSMGQKGSQIPEYVEGEAIVCYKTDVKRTAGNEEKEKQEAERNLLKERYVSSAEALLSVEDIGAAEEAIEAEDEKSSGSTSDPVTDAADEAEEEKPGVIALVQSDNLSTEELIAEMMDREDVLCAEPNYIQSIQSADLTDQQWGNYTTYGIGVDGWNTYSGDTPTPAVDTSAEVVAVLDTGVDYLHEDLKDVMWDEGLNYPELVEMGGGAHGINVAGQNTAGVVYDTKDPMDDNNHGSHCAGIIAATWNGTGVSGVTSGARIMAVKIGNDKGKMTTDATIKGVKYIIAAKRAGVNLVASNHSYGGNISGYLESLIIEEAGRNGIICVFAAGNSDMDMNRVNFSSSSQSQNENVVIVGASTELGEKAEFSNYGDRDVDVFAPGEEILSTVATGFGVPVEESKILEIDGVKCEVDYSEKDTLEDPILGITGLKTSATLRTAEDGKNVLHLEADEGRTNPCIAMKVFEDLSECRGGVIKIFSGQEGILSCAVYEYNPDSESPGVGIRNVQLKPGLNSVGFQYIHSYGAKEKKNIQLAIIFSGKDAEGASLSELDIRGICLNSEGGNYAEMDGTSMAAPMVTGGVAVLAAAYPDDSVEKLAARVTGSVLPVDTLSDICLSGGIFRLDKALAGETVPVPKDAYVEGKKLIVKGFFFGNQTGTLQVGGKKCKVIDWSMEKITAELPEDYVPGENKIEVTSGKGAGHAWFRTGTPVNQYPHLGLPGSTLSQDGEYRIPESALEQYADFYQGDRMNLFGMNGCIYSFVATKREGTAVYRYCIEEKQWEEVCSSEEYQLAGGVAAWNGKILIIGTNGTTNQTAIGTLDPVSSTLTWTVTNPNAQECEVSMVNNGYGIWLVGGYKLAEPTSDVNYFEYLRKLDPDSMKITEMKDVKLQVPGCHFGLSSSEDGTIYVGPGDELSSAEGIVIQTIRFKGAVPKKVEALKLGEKFREITEDNFFSCGVAATKEGLWLYGPCISVDGRSVSTDNYLLSYDGKKLTKQPKVLSYRPVYYPFKAVYNGVCYVTGLDLTEERQFSFSEIRGDFIEPYGVNAYSDEWVDGIRYGLDGFRDASYTEKASWKKEETGWRYQTGKNSRLKNRWEKIDGKMYFFDKKGIMEKNAYRDGWFLGKSGARTSAAKAVGWKTTKKGTRFYVTKTEYLKKCWKQIDGTTYYFDKNGYMEKSAYRSGRYLNKNGARTSATKATGWKTTKKGSRYYITKSKYLKKCWKKINGSLYYFDKDGYIETNAYRQNRYLKKSGAWDGKTVIGWKMTGNGKYYYITKTTYLKSGWKTIGGKKYYFNKLGIMTKKK